MHAEGIYGVCTSPDGCVYVTTITTTTVDAGRHVVGTRRAAVLRLRPKPASSLSS